jgi:aspartyl-tRNA(Asn)/glutamyl-tRNA(Gln) amidotransferase subunit A
MQSNEICFLSIAEAAGLIASKKLSPVEVISAHLERIEQTDGKLNSFITLLREESLDAAREAERAIQSGGYTGPLHGIPIGLKDLYYTRGVRTTIGSKIMRDFVPDYDAAVTERFRQAGAIIIGKLQMHEFALGSTSENPHYGPARNPWDTGRVTGGSSGGSGSAVAAGQCMGTLGSDTGGSIRIPAALCGIVGLKPTFGRVSRYGVFPLAYNMDTVGPMTRTVRDTALIMNAIAGYDLRDPSSVNCPAEDFSMSLEQGIRIGIPQEYFYDVIDSEVKESVYQATRVLEGLGAKVDEISIPVLNHSITISGNILLTEAAEVHMENLRQRADDIGADVRARLETGAMTTAREYIKAQRARRMFNQQIAETFQQYDLLLAPTEPIGAPMINEPTVQVGDKVQHKLALLPRLTRPFNICGVPTISVPCGFTSEGMPIGMQLAGRPFDDATVLKAAHAYEQATDWHTRRPLV